MANADMEVHPGREKFILHIMLCGFHHKKGCILEFVYPPLYDDEDKKNSLDLPPEWSNIPSLALPEGAHNYESDSVYFHVESRSKPNRTVFGVSTYRQIDSKAVVNKSSEVTRSSVQKSVCVLCTLPLYGVLKTKLNSITYSFFAGGDFSKTELLVATFSQLDAVTSHIVNGAFDELFIDIDLLSAYNSYRQDLLALFKLLLLEKRVLITGSQASRIANSILAVLSLFPGMVRQGLLDAVPSSADRLAADAIHDGDANSPQDVASKRKSSLPIPPPPKSAVASLIKQSKLQRTMSRSAENVVECAREKSGEFAQSKSTGQDNELNRGTTNRLSVPSTARSDGVAYLDSSLSASSYSHSIGDLQAAPQATKSPLSEKEKESKRSGQILQHGPMASLRSLTLHPPESKQNSSQSIANSNESFRVEAFLDKVMVGSSLSPSDSGTTNGGREDKCSVDSFGFPLVLYHMQVADSFCLPYACLQDLDWLMRTKSRSFLVGCNNPLFIMPTTIKIYDAIVDETKVKVLKHELNKLLKLSSADSKFLERLETATFMRRAHDDNLFDSTNWEGSDDWIRDQFRIYLIRLLRVALFASTEQSAVHEFGVHFVKAFRKTTAFRLWERLARDGRLSDELSHYPLLHPCSSQPQAIDSSGVTNDVNVNVLRSPNAAASELKKKNHSKFSAKQIVGSKFANFLGLGKESKSRKGDHRNRDSLLLSPPPPPPPPPSSAESSLVVSPSPKPEADTSSLRYEKASNSSSSRPVGKAMDDTKVIRDDSSHLGASRNEKKHSPNSVVSLRRWASSASTFRKAHAATASPSPASAATLDRR